MPIPNRISGDLYVDGNLSCRGLSLPASSVKDANIAAGTPGQYVSAEKITSQVREKYSQPNSAAISETRPIYAAYGANGSVLQFVVGSIAPAVGAATVTVDLKKNGASILTSVITLDNSNSSRVVQAGTISSAAYVVGDFFEVVIVATAGGGTLPTGVFVQMVADEDPQ